MAVLKCGVEFNLRPIQNLIKTFPSLGGRFLALVGKRGRTTLKEEFLSGQELTLHAYPTGKSGKRTITSDVNKRRTHVKIYSFPVNLFEKGRTLRSGAREPGKYIITRKLKQIVSSRMGNYISEFESKILEPEIKKLGLD